MMNLNQLTAAAALAASCAPATAPVTERELAAKAVAPRVTADDIESAIESEHYFTAADGVHGMQRNALTGYAPPEPLALLTICVLVLRNGFTVTGTSACASPANFDAGIGQRVARQDALRQVWPLLGYALRDRIAYAPAMAGAVEVLRIAAETCENNAPIHAAEGNAEQAELSRNNAVGYRAAIARLQP